MKLAHTKEYDVDSFRRNPTESLGDELKQLRGCFGTIEGGLIWSHRSPMSSAEISLHETKTTIASMSYISGGKIIWINRLGISMQLDSKYRGLLLLHLYPDETEETPEIRLMSDSLLIKKSLDRLKENRSDIGSEVSALAITSSGHILEAWDDVQMGDFVYRFSDYKAVVVQANWPNISIVGKAWFECFPFPNREEFITDDVESCRYTVFLGYSALRLFCTRRFWPPYRFSTTRGANHEGEKS